jgi:hypothetical protein
VIPAVIHRLRRRWFEHDVLLRRFLGMTIGNPRVLLAHAREGLEQAGELRRAATALSGLAAGAATGVPEAGDLGEIVRDVRAAARRCEGNGESLEQVARLFRRVDDVSAQRLAALRRGWS